VLSYLLFFYFLSPGLELILRYGKILSNHDRDPSSVVASAMRNHTGAEHEVAGRGFKKFKKPLHVAKEDAKNIMKRLKEIKNSKASVAAKKGLVRKVIPEWFRNEEESGGIGDALDRVSEGDEPDADAIEQEEFIKSSSSGRQILRTLGNKSQHYTNSQCPRDVELLTTTLVVQTTFDRLPLIQETCRRWKSPIILVVYLSPDESQNIWDKTVQDYSSLCDHLEMIPYIAASEDERKFAYPINKMRNIGLDHVITSHVLVLDVDLIPSSHLDDALVKAIELAIEARLDDDGDRGIDPKDAIVVPAFERKSPIACKTLQDCQNLMTQDAQFIPATMTELEHCLSDEKCLVFQSDVNFEGHADTHSMQWLKDEQKASLTPIKCFRSLRYEPYVVIPWCALEKNARQRIAVHAPRSPYYDERFHGYGKNKIQQIAHLRERGFTFKVMPSTGFVVHHPHPESITKEIWNDRENNELHQQMDALYPQYLKDLIREYQSIYNDTPLC
jgi:hypothetical protein